MLDLIFGFAQTVLHMNLRDPHDIPFALPLMIAAMFGFVSGFIMLQFIGNEHKSDRQNNAD